MEISENKVEKINDKIKLDLKISSFLLTYYFSKIVSYDIIDISSTIEEITMGITDARL